MESVILKTQLKTTSRNFFLIFIISSFLSDVVYAEQVDHSSHCKFTSVNPVKTKSTSDSRKKEIRYFVITNYRPLVFDLARGAGNYLDALLELLNLEVGQTSELSDLTQCLLTKKLSIPDFARALAELN